ncbi:MAG: hypothetical protein ACMXYD_03265 [Candidatus Woesearchaeota archaeon]
MHLSNNAKISAAIVLVLVVGAILFLPPSYTGQATQGQVNLAVASALAITVVSENNTINFGTCTPNASEPIIVDSNTSIDESNNQCNANLTTPQRIQVRNIGSYDAAVNLTSSCSAQQLISSPSDTGDFEITTFSTGGCTGEMISNYTSLTNTSVLACENLVVGETGTFWLAARITIPPDADLEQECEQTTLTFTAY